jgi:hypothetical protein
VNDDAAAVLVTLATTDLVVHPAARNAYGVWLAIAGAGFAPAQNPAVVTMVRVDGEPMLVCGFRPYTAARQTGANLMAVLMLAGDAAVSAMAWDEVIAVAQLLAMPEAARADLADRLVRQAPEAVRRALGLDRGAPMQAADSCLGVPVRARRALEARRTRPTVIAEALARSGRGP